MISIYDCHPAPVSLAAGLGAVLWLLLGCSVDTRASAPANGALALNWTINETTDVDQCNEASAASLSLEVYDGSGAYGTYSATCDAFAVTVSLPPGPYTAQAWFVDDSGIARTTTIDINPFEITEGTSLAIPIDFPASSFH
jgi:hypothetical protein